MTQHDVVALAPAALRPTRVRAATPEPARPRFSSPARADALYYGDAALFTSGRPPLLRAIDALVRRGGAHLVVTLNTNQSIDLRADAAYRRVFGRAAIRTLDGAPLVALARLLGVARPVRNTGADLLRDACRYAAEFHWRIAIVGSTPEITRSAVANLRATYGPVVDALPMGTIADPEDPSSEAVIAELERMRPQVVFLCLGAPKQELWFDAWRGRLPAGVYIGAGAAVDFAAGVRRRAPGWVQRGGGEWLWRLAQEPRRLAHRYLVRGPRFAGIAAESIAGSLLTPTDPTAQHGAPLRARTRSESHGAS